MNNIRVRDFLNRLVLFFCLLGAVPAVSRAQNFAVLHHFDSASDGSAPHAGLIEGSDGRLYGTTQLGGANDAGTVFAVATDGTGFVVLHAFDGAGDGSNPTGGLIAGSDGRLYGATSAGGADDAGTVFAMETNGANFTVLHAFDGANDGGNPTGALIEGSDGRLYGVASAGGASDAGTVFAVETNGSNFTVLHALAGADGGSGPSGGLIEGSDGRLYGVTSAGGANDAGAVFAVETNGSNFTVLHDFDGASDGQGPDGQLIEGDDGRLFGTTSLGGANSAGTVFALATDGTGFTVLHAFDGSGGGSTPRSGLIEGSDGRFYGTTSAGGGNGAGSVFALAADGTGFAVLHSLNETGEGSTPLGPLTEGAAGRLYGATSLGGTNGDGTVFVEIVPPVIETISPASGPTIGGTAVTVTGAHFTGATAVDFGGIAAVAFTVDSDTQITARSPAGSLGAVDVTVATAAGTSTATAADQFTYYVPATNADLAALTLSTGTLLPSFAGGTTSYIAILPAGTTDLTVIPTVAESHATLTVNDAAVDSGTASGSMPFDAGHTTVALVVTAEDGTTTETYTVTLASAPVVASPTATGITTTAATLGGTVAFDGNSAVTRRGVVYAPTAQSPNPQLSGAGVIDIPVAGATGTFSADLSGLTPDTGYSYAAYATNALGTTYTGVGTFSSLPASNADLAGLVLNAGALTPAFASGTTDYGLMVSSGTSNLIVTPTADDSHATVTVNGTAVASGTTGDPIALAYGDNTVTVVVTAQDGTTTKTYTLTVSRAIPLPSFTVQPADQGVTIGSDATLTVAVGEDATVQWQRNGVDLEGATGATLTLSNMQAVDAGLYRAVATNSTGTTVSDPAVVGILATDLVSGAGEVAATDVLHPNGHYYDQVLLTGPAAAITAQDGKVTRTSFIDLNDDIVQVEFSGAGTLSLVLDDPSGPAAPANYTQDVSYMKGHARIVIVGADATTNVSVFTVGRATAFDPTGHYNIVEPISETNDPANNGSPLFGGQEATSYDGVADIEYIAIASTDGNFGGVRTADARYWATAGITGLFAPGVDLQGPAFIANIDAHDAATPVIEVGSTDDARITGGSLLQTNGAAVQVHGLTQLIFTDGTDSGGNVLPAQDNQAVLIDDGVDVTSQIVVNP